MTAYKIQESGGTIAGVSKIDGSVKIDQAYFCDLEKSKHANGQIPDSQGGVNKAADAKDRAISQIHTQLSRLSAIAVSVGMS